jgi:polyvinyl alcohol dehydrogenase (cytochrome)
MFSLSLEKGERTWYAPPPGCGARKKCSPAQSAAVTAIPGVAFSGSIDGHLRAYSMKDGSMWDFDTAGPYETVNGVDGSGGSLDGAGPAIAGGVLFVNSGYPVMGGMPGNVMTDLQVTVPSERPCEAGQLCRDMLETRWSDGPYSGLTRRCSLSLFQE